MTKKLKIYSTLFVVALIVLFMSNTFRYWSRGWSPAPDNKMEFAEIPAEYMTRDTLEDGETVSYGHPYVTYELNVHSWSRPDHKVLLSTAQGQTYKVDMKKIKVSIPTSRVASEVPMYVIGSSAILAGIVCFWILWLVIDLISRIHHGEIFVAKVARNLEITGILLSVLYLYQLATSYLVRPPRAFILPISRMKA